MLCQYQRNTARVCRSNRFGYHFTSRGRSNSHTGGEFREAASRLKYGQAGTFCEAAFSAPESQGEFPTSVNSRVTSRHLAPTPKACALSKPRRHDVCSRP